MLVPALKGLITRIFSLLYSASKLLLILHLKKRWLIYFANNSGTLWTKRSSSNSHFFLLRNRSHEQLDKFDVPKLSTVYYANQSHHCTANANVKTRPNVKIESKIWPQDIIRPREIFGQFQWSSIVVAGLVRPETKLCQEHAYLLSGLPVSVPHKL